MTIAAVILILVAGLLTAGIGANVDQLHRSDAAGNGMADAFAYLFTVAVWIILGILLLMCGARGGFPRYSGVAMLFAFSLGIAAQVVTLRILTESRAEGAAAILLPMVTLAAPVLLIIRAAWGIFPPLRAAVPELAGGWAPILLLALISLVPFPFLPSYATRKAAQQADAAILRQESLQEAKAEHDQRTQETLARVAALPIDGDLFSVLTYSGYQDPVIREAGRARARTFTRRQSGAEELVALGQELALREIPNLDLTPTPALCEGAKKMLAAKGAMKPFDNNPVRIEDAEREVAPFLETMRWLVAKGCDCKSEISGLEQAVGRYANSRRREKLLADLAAAKSNR
jgi:hypothetical protein